MYRQGDIIAVHYPLTDKPAKSKLRPALVVSNYTSNKLDSDLLVCPNHHQNPSVCILLLIE
ncbi:type II toxin-antitoxin system PemK/MazF family toxin (plasmid) [Pedobacter sp. BS3]|uniref:type II toxin-antitoxin system PemK/MazF family toxin n=1 Tax=Pedobacter sp. BS3 TaxID=2567937 RepID=UPI0011EDBB20|nr:type II toxin-antitoxin system PemK/MazF family toxin [Pedobacter sp. BS3]